MKPDPRYPIGKFHAANAYTLGECEDFLSRISSLPLRIEAAVHGLTDGQLDTPYRDDGWTVRQVVHHVADSHMNAYIRVKWALTEESPIIKPYDEKAWASTPETEEAPALSLALLKSLHAKWVILLQSLTPEDLERQFIHPATQRAVRLDQLMAMYAWHGDHHLAHITELNKQKNWP
jgi:hypothetical protein